MFTVEFLTGETHVTVEAHTHFGLRYHYFGFIAFSLVALRQRSSLKRMDANWLRRIQNTEKWILSSTYKIPAISLVNEHEIFRIFEGSIFFQQPDWLSAQNYLILSRPLLHFSFVAAFCWRRCWLQELNVFISYTLMINLLLSSHSKNMI